jgi:hypothetical protein
MLSGPSETYREVELRCYEKADTPGNFNVQYFGIIDSLGIVLSDASLAGLKARIDAALDAPAPSDTRPTTP